MVIIKTVNLTKAFGRLVAVNNLSLEINEGECFGLLGPNGAGKTSLIRMITAVSPSTHGEIYVMGKDLLRYAREIKSRMGVVPQIDNLDIDLKVLQNLVTFARYFDIPEKEAYRRSLELLGMFHLEDKRDVYIRELSGGMKRRLLIARGLINRPRIIILDEPTVGLDPQSKYLVWQNLKRLKTEGVTQLLSTQNMEEAQRLSDRVAVMHAGKILALDTPQRLISGYVGEQVWEIELDSQDRDKIIRELEDRQLKYEEAGDKIQVLHFEGDLAMKVARFAGRQRPATLEDVFFKLTGRSLTE